MSRNRTWVFGGLRHRTDGPALEYSNGDWEWWRKGWLHRSDGPAVCNVSNGVYQWFLDDVEYTLDEWLFRTTDLSDEEKLMFKLQYG